jgi:CheY-like chemotaxis protein
MTKHRILVVDDDQSLRRVMKMQLEEAGYDVSLASNGDEAFMLLPKLRPSLVITDLQMPSSGLELLRQISTSDIDTTVIVITRQCAMVLMIT